MTSFILFLIIIPLLAGVLLLINFLFATHNPYEEKDSVFECGFHSFLGQNRTQFSISFFIFALLFLLFDLEILLVYPFVVSASLIMIYGLIIMLIFFILLTLGFVFELGKKALTIDSKQFVVISKKAQFFTPLMIIDLYSHINIVKGQISNITATQLHVLDWLKRVFNHINGAIKKYIEVMICSIYIYSFKILLTVRVNLLVFYSCYMFFCIYFI